MNIDMKNLKSWNVVSTKNQKVFPNSHRMMRDSHVYRPFRNCRAHSHLEV